METYLTLQAATISLSEKEIKALVKGNPVMGSPETEFLSPFGKRIVIVSKKKDQATTLLECPDLAAFLQEVMRRRGQLPSQLASKIGVSHATVSRWLSGKDIPNIQSCRRLSEYSGVPLAQVLSIAHHITSTPESSLPEFREYAYQKYPIELDEDEVTMIETLIERRRLRC